MTFKTFLTGQGKSLYWGGRGFHGVTRKKVMAFRTEGSLRKNLLPFYTFWTGRLERNLIPGPCDTLCRPLCKMEGRSCRLASAPLSLSGSSQEDPPDLREPCVPSSPQHERSWEGGRSTPFIAHSARSLGQDVQYSSRGALATLVITPEGSKEWEMIPHSPPHSPLQGRERDTEGAGSDWELHPAPSIDLALSVVMATALLLGRAQLATTEETFFSLLPSSSQATSPSPQPP